MRPVRRDHDSERDSDSAPSASQPLPPDVIANVIPWAADAVNRLHTGAANAVPTERDQRTYRQALTNLRSLVERYTLFRDAEHCTTHLDGLNSVLAPLIADAQPAGLPSRSSGKPRRIDLDHFGAVSLNLSTQPGWTLAGASRAIAALVENVWASDTRTQARAIARALYGPTGVEASRTDRRDIVADRIRKSAYR